MYVFPITNILKTAPFCAFPFKNIPKAAPMELRGPLVVSYNTLVVGGQFVATLVCGAFAEVHEGW